MSDPLTRTPLTPQEEQRLNSTHIMDGQTVFAYNYGIRLKGPFMVQKVTTLPSHSGIEDEGRLIYDMTESLLYIGTDTEWIPAGGGGGGGWFG